MLLAFWTSWKDECSRARELLSSYIDQRLDAQEVARVEGHLRTCVKCRGELESLRATVALLHRLPEVTPSRSFAVAPVRPLPERRALPALRYATAAAVLLLVAAFAVDGTGVLDGGMLSKPKAGPEAFNYGAITRTTEAESYWLVSGVKSSLSDNSVMVVELVVPDGTDNVQVAVNSLALANDGVLYGGFVDSGEVPQIALIEGDEGSVRAGEVEEFTVVSASDAEQSPFAPSGASTPSALDEITKGQLYIVASSSENNVLYSFDLEEARLSRVTASGDNDWLRPLEYGLIGLVAVLAGGMAAVWLKQRRARVAEVTQSQN